MTCRSQGKTPRQMPIQGNNRCLWIQPTAARMSDHIPDTGKEVSCKISATASSLSNTSTGCSTTGGEQESDQLQYELAVPLLQCKITPPLAPSSRKVTTVIVNLQRFAARLMHCTRRMHSSVSGQQLVSTVAVAGQ